MLDYLKGLAARIEVHWHVAATAFVTALPVLLDQLGVVDLHPIFQLFVSHEMADVLIGLMPFVLVFMKQLIKVNPHPDDKE